MMRQAQRHGFQILFTIVCLPYEAFYSLDAILRTMWRMLVSHKRLLEWNPFHNPVHNGVNDLVESCRSMWMAPVLSMAVLIYLSIWRTGRDLRRVARARPLVWILRSSLGGLAGRLSKKGSP